MPICERVRLRYKSQVVSHILSANNLCQLSFVADRQGSFRFRCTVTRANLHRFMIGKLQIGQNALQWRAVVLAVLALVAYLWTFQFELEDQP